MIIDKFKAVYNIFTRQLAVLYGDCLSTYTFEDMEEWTKVSFNGDTSHPNYLHIQSDYDESFQLLFYPREDGSPDLNEDKGTYFYSMEMDKVPENLKIVFNDDEYDEEYRILESLSTHKVEVEIGL